MKINAFQFLLCLLLFFLLSCGLDTTIQNQAPKVRAIAQMDEVIIVCDQAIWEGIVGDSLRYYFEGPYPVTPRGEPMFKVRHFTVQDLNGQPIRKELRTYLIVADLHDSNSPTSQLVLHDLGENNISRIDNDTTFHTSIGRNKWAIGQIVMYLFGKSQDDLSKLVSPYFIGFANQIYDHDLKPLAQSTYARGENKNLTARINRSFNLNIKIPADYIIAYDKPEENIFWLRKDLSDVEQHLIFRKFPYHNKNQFSIDSLISYRNTFGSLFEFNQIKGSTMQVNHIDLPVFEYPTQINGKYSREYRGIWELKTDFIGGSFIDYIILNKEQNEIIYIAGTVLRVGKNKKLFLKQLEYIIKHSKIYK